MDYPNFEIVVIDDSTDETTEIVKRFAKKHNKAHPRGPKIKVLHRPTRQGFKGGALAYALERMNPKTEFIVVLDADFIPYPDTLELFVKYFKANNQGREDYIKSNIAVIGGYQWHVLNKSENWITRGVRTEYAGSYVIERPGREILGLLKQISGSVYMIRADLLKKIGWGTSITEDFQLTLKLYEQGYKVIYTPYIQAPAECVSTLKRLVRQRMRWSEGHSNNIRKMFVRLMSSPKLTPLEKLEVFYLSPYYLQALFFLVGTFSWLLAEVVFPARLPFWTSLWGWSLVLTNMFSLPLVNAVGLFLEESEERDYLGLLSFLALSYIMVPFQAYASIKGFIEKEEGPWFRTPKTGKITDIFTRGRFYRWISGILPGRQPAPAAVSVSISSLISANPYMALATANNQFNSFQVKPKRIRWVSKVILVILLIFSLTVLSLGRRVSMAQATPVEDYWLRTETTDEDLVDLTTLYAYSNADTQESMRGTIGSTTKVQTQGSGDDFLWFSQELPTGSGTASVAAGTYTFRIYVTWAPGSGKSVTWYAEIGYCDGGCDAAGDFHDLADGQCRSNNITSEWDYWMGLHNETVCTTTSSTTIGSEGSKGRFYFLVHTVSVERGGNFDWGYGGSSYESRLDTPTVAVPEKSIYLVAAAPFIPMIVLWMRRKEDLAKSITQ